MAEEHPMFIPPPPLPEFYTPKETKLRSASSSTSCGESGQRASDHARETRRSVRIVSRTSTPLHKKPGTMDVSVRREHEGCAKNVSQAGAPAKCELWFNAGNQQHYDGVPPLAVYHICRLCLRPRSARYHREHPIPIDGMPPPPGICRRCRVTSVEEEMRLVKIVDVAEESEKVKLGVRCLVPDEDYISREEIARNRIDCTDDRGPLPSVKRKDIIYRHVRIIEDSPERVSPDPIVVVNAAVRQQHAPVSKKVAAIKTTTAPSLQVERASGESSATSRNYGDNDLRRVDSARATVRSKESHSGHHRAPVALSEVRVDLDTYRAERSESEIRRLARNEIENFEQVTKTARPERTDSEIRRIAREEVERYRQAERKIEAHSNAYSHGRIVPVQRRIAASADVSEEKPWTTVPRETAREIASSSTRGKSRPLSNSVVEEVVTVRRSRNVSQESQKGRCRIEKDADFSSGYNQVPNSDITKWVSKDWASDQESSKLQRRQARSAQAANYETIEVTGVARRPPQTDSWRARDVNVHRASNQQSDQEYWSDEERAWVVNSRRSKAPLSESGSKSRAKAPRRDSCHDQILSDWDTHKMAVEATSNRESTARDDGRTASRSTARRHSSGQPDPEVGQRESMARPVPQAQRATSHEMNGSKSSRPGEDQSYVYVERTLTAVKKPNGLRSSNHSRDNSYMEKEVLLQRKTPAKGQTTTASAVGSGRVHFSNRIEVSPTPPGSDASSLKFRDLGKMGQRVTTEKAPATDLPTSGHRGRSRSRASSGQTGYIYEQESVSMRERHRPTAAAGSDGKPTSKAGSGSRRPSPSTTTATQVSQSKPLARALSESPSREKLRLAAARDATKAGGPPYANPDDQLSDDLEVQDGSEQDADEERRRRPSRGYRRREGRR